MISVGNILIHCISIDNPWLQNKIEPVLSCFLKFRSTWKDFFFNVCRYEMFYLRDKNAIFIFNLIFRWHSVQIIESYQCQWRLSNVSLYLRNLLNLKKLLKKYIVKLGSLNSFKQNTHENIERWITKLQNGSKKIGFVIN